MRVLILGCAGYIGSVVSQHLVSRGYTVVGVDSLLYSQISVAEELNKLRDFTFIEASLGDVSALPRDVDAVVNLAGYVGGPITEKLMGESYQANVVDTIASIDSYRSLPVRYIFVSTCSNYGLSDELVTEESPLSPLTPYATQKVAVEKYLQNLPPQAFSPVTLRFATAFGPSLRTRVDLTINEFVFNLLSQKSIDIYGAHAWRPYCHVEDFAAAIEMVLRAPKNSVCGQVYNVGCDSNNYTKAALVNEITKQLPGAEERFSVCSNVDLRDYRVSFKKFNTQFSHRFVSVPDGIAQMIQEFRTGLQGWVNTPISLGSNRQLDEQLDTQHKIQVE